MNINHTTGDIVTSNNIRTIFEHFFAEYKSEKEKDKLTYVITSTNRPGNLTTNPHAYPNNAFDITLRTDGKYADISEYNELFEYMLDNWPFRAGIDNTWKGEKVGNVHIHLDLGNTRPKDQYMPYFFKENHGKWTNEITNKDQIK